MMMIFLAEVVHMGWSATQTPLEVAARRSSRTSSTLAPAAS